LFFFQYAFGRFSVRRVHKHHKNTFTQSPSCRKIFPKKSRKLLMSVFPQLFCFLAFSGVYQRWEFKNTTKNILWSGPRPGGLTLRLRDSWGTEVRGWSSLALGGVG
jgi:hypothetical protein